MTPEELTEIEKRVDQVWDGGASVIDTESLIEEVRRLWAERDARLLVGQPVSENLIALAMRWRHEDSITGNGEPSWPMMLSKVDLMDHITFLERLLADADDLPQVRRTGYADGWRAALEAAASHLMRCYAPEWSYSEKKQIADELRELEP